MIKTMRLLCGFMAIAVMAFVASCSDDDPNIGSGGSIPVADGFYISPVGGEPTEYNVLKEEKVELGFGTQVRDGYYANYMFLEAGEYNLVTIVDQEFGQSFGGEDTQADSLFNEQKSECDGLNAYSLVNDVVENGVSFTVVESGLYYVGYDVSLTEVFYTKIEVANVIGDATPASWSHSDAQTMQATSVSATGATFRIEDLVLRPGLGAPQFWKVRFNCRWKIGRMIDRAIAQTEPTNGYNALINLGGTPSDLETGGANFEVALGEDGEYTIELNWTPEGGWAMELTKTLALDPLEFQFDDFQWAVVGSATPTGWPSGTGTDEDTDMTHSVSGDVHSWTVTVALTASPDAFKFRKNYDWAGDLEFSGVDIDGPDAGLVAGDGGDNFTVSQAGTYTLVLRTEDFGASWILNVDKQ